MTVNKPMAWQDWFIYVVRLFLIALIGYGFSNYRQQIDQDNKINVLQQQVITLSGEVKVLNDQHQLMLRQQAEIKQNLEDLERLHTEHYDKRR